MISNNKKNNNLIATYNAVHAESHTPPYKIHKYFARRPWNVFSQLVKNFSLDGEIILDPFCGGGVTVYEGLKQNRRVIGCDLNPLSIYVVKNMVKSLDDDGNLKAAINSCKKYLQDIYSERNYFINDGTRVEISWSELAFVVNCPYCGKEIIQKNENKVRNGVYKCANDCPSMQKEKKGVESRLCKKVGTRYLYNIGYLNGEKTVKPFDHNDLKLINDHVCFLEGQIEKNKIKIPQDKIPLDWDRQLEDQLAKKEIHFFQDLFTRRNLLINLLLLNHINSYKSKLTKDEYELLRLVLSNTVKDTNIMSFTNDTWQSGKPTTWSKHAYWVPSQFCEVGIIDSFNKAAQRIIASVEYNKVSGGVLHEGVDLSDIYKNLANMYLWNQSVADLEIEKESVDAIVTDPPYGSNVQYLELSHFWYPWNKDLYNVVPDFNKEAISNRKKNFKGAKSMYDYENNLFKVFSQSYRALKFDKYMVLTFNNKDIAAWLSLLFSIFKSGFTLEINGIYFQDGVKNYKQTAHTKYDGSPYGDFIYVFKKSNQVVKRKKYYNEDEFINDLENIFNSYLKRKDIDKNELITKMFLEAMPIIEGFAKSFLMDNNHFLYSHFKKNYFDHLYA